MKQDPRCYASILANTVRVQNVSQTSHITSSRPRVLFMMLVMVLSMGAFALSLMTGATVQSAATLTLALCAVVDIIRNIDNA